MKTKKKASKSTTRSARAARSAGGKRRSQPRRTSGMRTAGGVPRKEPNVAIDAAYADATGRTVKREQDLKKAEDEFQATQEDYVSPEDTAHLAEEASAKPEEEWEESTKPEEEEETPHA